MAWSRAAWVLGGVRLISSANRMLVNTGPFTKRNTRSPLEGYCWITSVPVMSAGMRSGVNWMRLKWRSMARLMVWTMSVLASPGTPTMRQWPRAKMAVSRSSMICSWPMITRPIWARSVARKCLAELLEGGRVELRGREQPGRP